MYKANKEQVSVFGLRTQFGGGKTTGFALVYDSPEAMKKFEPQYRLVRFGLATKVERASRQQRMLSPPLCFAMLGTLRILSCGIMNGMEWEFTGLVSILLTFTSFRVQASSARTDRRPSEERQRSRVRSRRRRNKRLAFFSSFVVCLFTVGVGENSCASVHYIQDATPHPANGTETIHIWRSIHGGREECISSVRSSDTIACNKACLLVAS